MPHCDHCATAELNEHGLRRAHCATCSVLCWDDPRSFEAGMGFCSNFCADVKLTAVSTAPDGLQYWNTYFRLVRSIA
jgi:hypothetical protein